MTHHPFFSHSPRVLSLGYIYKNFSSGNFSQLRMCWIEPDRDSDSVTELFPDLPCRSLITPKPPSMLLNRSTLCEFVRSTYPNKTIIPDPRPISVFLSIALELSRVGGAPKFPLYKRQTKQYPPWICAYNREQENNIKCIWIANNTLDLKFWPSSVEIPARHQPAGVVSSRRSKRNKEI